MRDLISKGLLTAAAATSVLSLGGGNAFASDAQGAAVGSPGVLSGNNVQVPVDIPVNACGNSVDVVGLLNPAFGNHCANTTTQHTHRQYEQGYRDATEQAGPQGGGSTRAAAPAAHTAGQTAAPATLPAPAHKPIPGQVPGLAVPSPASPMGTPVPNASAASGTSGTSGTSALSAVPQQYQHDQQQPMAQAAQHRSAGAPAGGQSAYAGSGAEASGVAQHSPGLLSGNMAQAPLDIPVNACGNSVDVVGLLNPAFGNTCESGSVPAPPPPHMTVPPVPEPPRSTPPLPPAHHRTPHVPVHHTSYVPPVVHTPPVAQLAHTGADGNLLAAAALSSGLLLGGTVLYRRSTATARARA